MADEPSAPQPQAARAPSTLAPEPMAPQRAQEVLLKELEFRSIDSLFESLDKNHSKKIDAVELSKGLQVLGVVLDFEHIEELMRSVGGSPEDGITFNQFEKIISQMPSATSETVQWLETLHLPKLVAEQVDISAGRVGDEGLGTLKKISEMSKQQIKKACAAVAQELEKVLEIAIDQLRDQPEQQLRAEDVNSKFQMTEGARVGNFAELKQFYGGLDSLIGLPSPKVFEAMRMEHCFHNDSDFEFKTSNYGGTVTTPSTEWEFVVDPKPDKRYPGQGRTPKVLAHFLQQEMASKAQLSREEVVALRMYTGPMYMKYNSVLRKSPKRIYESLKGNEYVTTIHCIVSGIIKLSQIWKLPEGRRVYRGLGGMLLPEAFWQPNQYGCKGGVELSMISTTCNKEVAIQYSGMEKGRPCIFEIEVGQIDRGASLQWLSQYPGEEEVLMPPLSNLEVIGDAKIETSSKGPVMVIPLRVNVNIKSSTIEEILAKRHQLHASMVKNLLYDCRHDLIDEVQYGQKEAEAGLPGLETVMEDMKQLLLETEKKEANFYNEDENYKNALITALDVKKGTINKCCALKKEQATNPGSSLIQKMVETRNRDWAQQAFEYKIRSGTELVPWEAISEGKLTVVEAPSSMGEEQADLFWQCIQSSTNFTSEKSRKVQLHGPKGRLVKIDAHQALHGSKLSLWDDKLDLDGSTSAMPQCPWDKAVRLLLPALQRNENLTALDLGQPTMGHTTAKRLASILASKTRLTSLTLTGDPVPIALLRSSSSLDLATSRYQQLEKDEDELGRDESTESNQSWLRRLSSKGFGGKRGSQVHPEEVQVQRTEPPSPDPIRSPIRGAVMHSEDERPEIFGWDEGICLSAFLASNSTLQEIRMPGHKIGAAGATALANALKQHNNLVTLDVRDNNIGPHGATMLGEAVLVQGQIQKLDLRGNSLGSTGPKALAPMVTANSTLTALNAVVLSEVTGVKPSGAGDSMVKGMRWKLEGMSEPGYEAAFMSKLLSHHADTQVLILAHNKMGIAGASALSEMLPSFQYLTALDLSDNSLRTDGIGKICSSIQGNKALTSLNLSDNSISMKGISMLAESLSQCPGLKSLDVSGNLRWRDLRKLHILRAKLPRVQIRFYSADTALFVALAWANLIFSLALIVVGFYFMVIGANSDDRMPQFIGGIIGIWIGTLTLLRLLRAAGVVAALWQLPQVLENAVLDIPAILGDEGSNDIRRVPSLESNEEPSLSNEQNEAGARMLELEVFAASTKTEMAEAAAGNSRREGSVDPGQHVDTPGLLGRRSAVQWENDSYGESKLDDRVLQLLPTLTKHFILSTSGNDDLDKEMEIAHNKMEHHSLGVTTAKSQFAAALRQPWSTIGMCIAVAYYVLLSFVMLSLQEKRRYSSFILQITKTQADGATNLTSNIDEFFVYNDGCKENSQFLIQGNASLLLNLIHPVLYTGFSIVLNANASREGDPSDFKLLGCESGRRCMTEVSNEVIDVHNGWVPTVDAGDEEYFDNQEYWQTRVLRYVPVVYCAGFFGLLVIAYVLDRKYRKFAKWPLIASYAINMLLYAVSSEPVNEGDTESYYRCISAVCILPFAATLLLEESAAFLALTFYGFLYAIICLVGFSGLYESDPAQPRIEFISGRNYDQFSFMPIGLLISAVFGRIIVRNYIRYRSVYRAAKPDAILFRDIWTKVCGENNSALIDLRSEVDRIRRSAPRASRVRQILPSQKVSAGWQSFVPNHMQSSVDALTSFAVSQRYCTSLKQLYVQANGLRLMFREKTQTWAADSGGFFKNESGEFVKWLSLARHPDAQKQIRWPDLKPVKRAIEKVYVAYGTDVSKIKDICRTSVYFDSVEALVHCLAVVRQDREVEIMRVYNRMDPDGVEVPELYSGYRDVALSLQIKTAHAIGFGLHKHIVELRLVLLQMAKCTTGEEGDLRHARYIAFRNGMKFA